MKLKVTLCLIVIGPIALVAEIPSLDFPATVIDLPPLTLMEHAKQGMPPVFSDLTGSSFTQKKAPLPSRKFVSRMPILKPADDVDYRMRVVPTDESVEYNIRVITPDIASAR